MVFKKPYGFLIKHFKAIHLVLTFLFILLSIKLNNLYNYYNSFIVGSVSKLDAIGHINSYYLIPIILSFVICVIIYLLMRYKKKPRLLYILLFIFYLAIAIFIPYCYSGLNTIYFSNIDSKDLRLYRDLINIVRFPQYLTIIVTLIRGLGFDIKKFDFAGDLVELGLAEEDSEEVELTLGDNPDKALRKFRRKLREFKYYCIENKPFLILFSSIFVVIAIIIIYVNVAIIFKVYKEGENFSTNSYNFNIARSYITNKGYDGNFVLDKDKAFVIVKAVVGVKGSKREFTDSNLILKVGHKSYSHNSKYWAKFTDIGTTYRGEKIYGSDVYLFTYIIDSSELKNKMSLVYANEKTVKLSPVNLDMNNGNFNMKVKDNIDLSKTTIGSGNFLVDNYEVNNLFSYSYKYEIGGKLYDGMFNITGGKNTIMHLKLNSNISTKLSNYKFLSTYAKLKYIVDDVEYTSLNFDDKTPGDYKEGLYLLVDKNIEDASSIWFEIIIRGRKYKYVLK